MTAFEHDKAARRVMRFLSKGPAVPTQAAGGESCLLDGGDRGFVSLSRTMLREMIGRGLVRLAGERIELGDAGLAASADVFQPRRREMEAVVRDTGGGSEALLVNQAESPLTLLRRHRARDGSRFLTEREFMAGERLRADYTRGQIMPRMGVNWDAAGAAGRKGGGHVNGIAELSDAALSARLRVERAIEAVGPELAGVLVDVCCFLKGLETVEAERHWPVRSAKVVLKTALGALARHYDPPRDRRPRAFVHWGAADFRPTIGGR